MAARDYPGSNGRSYPVGSAGGDAAAVAAANDVIDRLRRRWDQVAEWRPDLTQSGFPGTLQRFSQVGGDTLVEASAASFNAGFRHRQILRDITAPTAAAVLREALDGTGADGNQSCNPTVGFEVFAQVRIDAVPPTGGWLIIGAFASAGAFPFVDIWSLANQVGVGRTTLATATPAGALEAISTNGTGGGNRTRSAMAGALVTGQWLQVSVRVYRADETGGARARMRVRNMVTGVEVEQTIATTLPAAMMHAGIIHDVGVVTPSGPANLSIARFAVGRPS